MLQQELSHRGVTAEVLNLSAPSKRLEQIVDELPEALARFIRLVRAHGATPVCVLQVTQSPPDPSLRTLRLEDRRAVKAAIAKAVAADTTVIDTRYSTRLWTYQAQVLVEVVRRTGGGGGGAGDRPAAGVCRAAELGRAVLRHGAFAG